MTGPAPLRPRSYAPEQVAEMWGCSPDHVRKLTRTGELRDSGHELDEPLPQGNKRLRTRKQPNAVDWNGPWALGKSQVIERTFKSEAECRNSAIMFIGKMHEGMLAPIRFQCVPVAAGLPVNAPR